jgi:uncharacterized phage protein (predicted DNA packaging)
MIVSLTEAKSQLRVETSDEDALITIYIQAAEKWIEKYIDSDIEGMGESPQNPPELLKLAALVLVADFYSNRGDGQKDQMAAQNFTATRLCDMYRFMTL